MQRKLFFARAVLLVATNDHPYYTQILDPLNNRFPVLQVQLYYVNWFRTAIPL